MFKKKSVVPDKMIPVTKFAFAKDKNGSLIRYFGIPVAVDLSGKKDKFVTVGGIDTRKLVSVLWLNSPNSVSEETAAWQKLVLHIDTENEADIDHPVILVDNRLLKPHFGGLSKKQVRAVIAFYSAKAMMGMDGGSYRLLDYLSTVADENAAKALFDKIEQATDEALEYVSDADVLAIQLLLAASEVNMLPRKIHRAVAKNEVKVAKFATKNFKIGKKNLKKVEKAEKAAAKNASKIIEMKDTYDTASDDDLIETDDADNISESGATDIPASELSVEIEGDMPMSKEDRRPEEKKNLSDMLEKIEKKLDSGKNDSSEAAVEEEASDKNLKASSQKTKAVKVSKEEKSSK